MCKTFRSAQCASGSQFAGAFVNGECQHSRRPAVSASAPSISRGAFGAKRVFSDTCSFINMGSYQRDQETGVEIKNANRARVLMDQELPNLCVGGTLVVPYSEMKEMKNLAVKRKDDSTLVKNIYEVYNRVIALVRSGRVLMPKGEHDPFVDAIFIRAAVEFRSRYDLVFITQDRKLAQDLIDVRGFGAINAKKKLDVMRVTKGGHIVNWRTDDNGRLLETVGAGKGANHAGFSVVGVSKAAN